MDELKIGFKKYKPCDELTLVENGTIQKFSYKDKVVIYKKYSTSSDYIDELSRYKKLYKSGIRVPNIVKDDKANLAIAFEYIKGDRVDKLLYDHNFELPDIYFERLFVINRFCRASGIELNYLPENFVLKDKLLYYESFDIFDSNEKINLTNYGLQFWINSKKGYEHLEHLGYTFTKKSPLNDGEVNKKIVLLSIKYW